MTERAACTSCGTTEDVEHIADLADGVPLLVCRRCLVDQAADALVNELRRRGADPAVLLAFEQRRRSSPTTETRRHLTDD